MTCILPNQWEGTLLGGQNGSVVFFDLDCRFDTARLYKALASRVSAAQCEHQYHDCHCCAATIVNYCFAAETPCGCQSIFVRQALASTFLLLLPLAAAQHGAGRSQELRERGGASSYHILAEACMTRFQLLKCQSTFQFLCALKVCLASVTQGSLSRQKTTSHFFCGQTLKPLLLEISGRESSREQPLIVMIDR